MQILLDFLIRAGVSMDDAYSVATVLDGFRARNAANGNPNQVLTFYISCW